MSKAQDDVDDARELSGRTALQRRVRRHLFPNAALEGPLFHDEATSESGSSPEYTLNPKLSGFLSLCSC